MSSVLGVPEIVIDRSEFPKPPRRESHITTPADKEFFETFMRVLAEHGFDRDESVFRGFDGGPIKQDGINPEAGNERIWVMSAAFWDWSLEGTATAAAINYAEKHEVPCIGIYDINQLRVDEDHLPSQPLTELRGTTRGDIFHQATHIDFPQQLPAAALQGLVFFEYGE